MQETIESIAGVVVERTDKEDIIFVKKSILDNMYQLIFEQRIKFKDIEKAVAEKSKPDDLRKVYSYFANELVKYLAAKLTKAKMAGFRGTPQTAKAQDKKMSKSEQFLERKRKEALEKASKENEEKSGQAEKIELIELKDIGKELEEREETMKKLGKKREQQQKSTETEYEKHTFLRIRSHLNFMLRQLKQPPVNVKSLKRSATQISTNGRLH